MKSKKELKKSFYNSKLWKNIRLDILLRDIYCVRCGSELSNHIDHCVPFNDKYDELATDYDNLYGLCLQCHSAVTTPDEHKYRELYDRGISLEEIADKKYSYKVIGDDGYPTDKPNKYLK